MHLTPVERDRLLNAVLLFARRCGPMSAHKLFKMLYILDVRHFQVTGRSVTGLTYAAYTPNPVPPALAHWLEAPPPPLAALVRSMACQVDGKSRQEFVAVENATPELDVFTPRQLALMDDIAVEFRDASATQIDVSRFDNGAWLGALKRGRESIIPLEETLSAHEQYRDDKIAASEQHKKRTRHLQAMV